MPREREETNWSAGEPSGVFAAAAVVAPHPVAAAAARDVLLEGGNAVEAAVAASAVAAVALPERAGLAADALWTIRAAGAGGRVWCLDARGRVGAGIGLDPDDPPPPAGVAAVTTSPGAVAGWAAALELAAALGGRLPLRRLLEPAIAAAREGVAVPPSGGVDKWRAGAEAQPGFAEHFLVDGRWPSPGRRRRAPALAETLDHLAHAGLADFWRGDVAREIAADLERLGSRLRRDDLRATEGRWRAPLALDGRRTVSAPPTEEGLVLLLGQALLAGRRPAPDTPAFWRDVVAAQALAEDLVLEAAREGRDPSDLMGAAAAGGEVLVPSPAAPSLVGPGLEGEAGAWLGVVDAEGLAVSLAVSMGRPFGAGVVLPRTGLLMNARGAALGANLRAGRRAPMAAWPVVASGPEGRLALAGTCGAGGRLRAARLLVAFGDDADLARAVEASCPRSGWLDGDAAILCDAAFDTDVVISLRREGVRIEVGRDPSTVDAGVLVRRAPGRLDAAADPRLGGTVAGF